MYKIDLVSVGSIDPTVFGFGVACVPRAFLASLPIYLARRRRCWPLVHQNVNIPFVVEMDAALHRLQIFLLVEGFQS